jgi:cytochrome c oxidase subunit 2
MVVLMRYASRALTPLLGALAVAMLVASAAPASLQKPPTDDARAETPQVIEISAERFAFTPSEIRVRAGTRLELRLRSDDTAHGFHILGTDIDIELPKRGRGVATVTFQPKAGRYTFECSRICGAGHEFMHGVLVAAE